MRLIDDLCSDFGGMVHPVGPNGPTAVQNASCSMGQVENV